MRQLATDMTDADASALTISVMTAFLRVGKSIDHASSVLLLASVLLYGVQRATPLMMLAAALALSLGLLEKYYAWRVALDAELFALLGCSPNQMAAFDEALAACLGRNANAPLRSLHSRWRGAKRLLRYQAAACVLQAVTAAALIALKALPA